MSALGEGAGEVHCHTLYATATQVGHKKHNPHRWEYTLAGRSLRTYGEQIPPMRPPLSDWIVFLPAPAWQETCHFYEAILGLSCVLDQGDCRIYRVAGSGYVGFCQRGEAPQPTERVILTLVTEAVDEWHAHLQAHGVAILKPPTYNEKYRIYHLFAQDPNGYLIEIQRFEDPRWGASSGTL